jgi:hypothetical protein
MSALPVSSQTVVAYLGYLLESGTISAKSLQPYLSAINAVHNDFEYPPPACRHLVKLARKGFAELQGSSILQPQEVTVFPAEHMFTIVTYGLRPNVSRHHTRVCACLTSQFFSPADSGVLLTAIITQVSDSTLSIYHTQSSHTLFVLNSSRSRQLLQQAPLENATQPRRHRSLLVLSRASCVIDHKLGHHYRVTADPLGGTRHSNPSRSSMDRSFFTSRWRLYSARHRRVDCSHHDLGLVEVSRLNASLHRELVDRPERRFRSVVRARCLASSLSSGSTTRCPYQQWLAPF